MILDHDIQRPKSRRKDLISYAILGACIFNLTSLCVAQAPLPKGVVVERVVAAQEEDSTAAPYLSVNIDGHTASINSLGFSPDSKTLYSAGQDKVVHAWKYADGRAKAFVVEAKGWHKSHTIRWEIARSIRGSIYSLAVSPGGGSVAIAGYGARGTAGDIVFADAETGVIKSVARREQSGTVVGLSYSSDGRWLVSSDIEGKPTLWDVTRNPPAPVILPADKKVSGNSADVFSGSAYVIRRRFKETKVVGARAMNTFQLEYYDVNRGSSAGVAPIELFADISALAASRDGKTIAVCDAARKLHVYETGKPAAFKLPTKEIARSLCFSPDGRYLAVGTMKLGNDVPQVQLWDTLAKKQLFARALPRSVTSVAFSPDGRWLAHNGAESHDVYVWEFDGRGGLVGERPKVLSGGDRIVSINTAKGGGFQADIKTNSGAQWKFNPSAIDGDPLAMAAKAMVLEPVDRGAWTLRQVGNKHTLQLIQGGAARGFIQLDPLQQGGIATPNSYCIVPDKLGRPIAVAVGTDTSNEIFVYNLAAAGRCSQLRRFRGHFADVMALNVTSDRRYLVSGSADGTLRYWKLDGLADRTFSGRWGADVEVVKGGLKVTQCSDSSPLFHKGVRAGDIISKIVWGEGENGDGRTLGTIDPEAMEITLRDEVWNKQFGMDIVRGGKKLDRFNVVSGWHHLLAVYVHGREWIAWHPSGYFACSPGGNKLIGWQVNKDIGDTPKLFPAVQFHNSLYRPKEVSKLLSKGGLEKLDVAVSEPPSPPQVELVSPGPVRVKHDKPEFVIRARARATGKERLVAMQLYIDDRPGEILSFEADDRREGAGWVEGKWTVALESSTYKFKVRADTLSCHGFSTMKEVEFQPERATRTLHLLTVAVTDYKEVGDLKYCVFDAQRMDEIFKKQGGLFDDVRVTSLHNEKATKPNIEAAFDQIVAEAGKDDLVLLFYSGHGYQHNGRFFMVTQNAEVPKGIDADEAMLERLCVSEDRIKEFCKGVARKTCSMMIMLDACHSGAARPVDFKELSVELGTSDFNAVMMASSRGDQFSWEHPKFGRKVGGKVGDPVLEKGDVPGGGAFTQALWWGLYHQEANYKPNKLIETRELSQYLEFEIPQLVEKVALGGVTQTPITNCFGLNDIPLILLAE